MACRNIKKLLKITLNHKRNNNQKLKIMKKVIYNLALIMGCVSTTFAQTKSSIAVTNPSVNGLFATPTIASKLIRLELIKLNIYTVYDEFDMADAYKKNPEFLNNCVSKTCLVELGKELNVDYTVSGSYDALGDKIVLTIKIIDVKNDLIFKTGTKEFDNQEPELQRMTEILLNEMHGIESPKELVDRLKFKNELITSNNVGKVNNSGPRVGYAYMVGSMAEFATRSTDRGGLDIFPGISMIGYQVEGQYVGTENFSALIEGVFNVSGLEQGQFIPTATIMNGFRFGKAGWEFGFGPGFGLKKVTNGFFDSEGTFGDKDTYFNNEDWTSYAAKESLDPTQHPSFFNTDGTMKTLTEINSKYNLSSKHADTRGDLAISTMFVMAIGRTFRAGSLNIPVNVFYSSRKGGGMVGVSVGFNVMKSKKPINSKK